MPAPAPCSGATPPPLAQPPEDPISMAVALQDYVAPDCRFLTIHRGQVVYVYSKLKGRGRLFWGGSVQGDYYGDLAARLGYFPSSIVREESTLKPGKIEVKTDALSILPVASSLQPYPRPSLLLPNPESDS
nr:melanoma-derived growth regulatory protein isoform X4 [Equus asinus]